MRAQLGPARGMVPPRHMMEGAGPPSDPDHPLQTCGAPLQKLRLTVSAQVRSVPGTPVSTPSDAVTSLTVMK